MRSWALLKPLHVFRFTKTVVSKRIQESWSEEQICSISLEGFESRFKAFAVYYKSCILTESP